MAGMDDLTGEDGIRPRSKRKLDDAEMDITPMIDITFLLLIFFLVASKMDTPAAVKLPEARNGGAVGTRNSVVVTILQEGDKAVIYKGEAGPGSSLTAKDPIEQESEIAAYIESVMQEDQTKTAVLIKAEKQVKHREVGRVAKAVSRVTEVQQLHVAVMERN